ncbi:MAG: ABC transporter substrate-binding protein, partial [Cyanobacteria bacterium P01_F01_bin.53]
MKVRTEPRYRQFLWAVLMASGLAISTAACSTNVDNPGPEGAQSNSAQSTTEKTDGSANNSSAVLSEASGTLKTTNQTAQRIVALTSLSADLVATLDADKLVGIPGSPLISTDPRFADIESVSEGRSEPNLEKIVALSPDLVIGAKGIQDIALQKLNDLNIQTLTVDINSWENLKDFTAMLAATVEADPQPLLERYEACLANIPQKETTSLVLVSRQPLLAPNKNSWAGDFLSKMNIQNLAADLQGESPFDGYITLSAEKVIEANPDSLIVVNTREDLLSQLKAEPFWSQLKAT